jgi:hypothetical protein
VVPQPRNESKGSKNTFFWAVLILIDSRPRHRPRTGGDSLLLSEMRIDDTEVNFDEDTAQSSFGVVWNDCAREK